MEVKLLRLLILAMLIGLSFFSGPVTAEVDCAKISHWSATKPSINQRHLFCGEWNKRKNRPVGFHSRPAGENPASVGTLKITQQPNAQGIYGVRWSFTGHPDPSKYSSMFPDTCNRKQILNSIFYAVEHSKPCPQGAPRWARCGPNKPIRGGHEYCEASDNSIFTIVFATLKNDKKVNTAFPLAD